MPKINTNNPKVRKYFVDICANWVENYGIDGIRLDVANEVSHRFCKELHARVKEINPDIYILGEIWHNALPWLRGDEFDAVMNYPLGQSIKDFWIDKSLTNEDFEYTINRCYTSYMQQTNDVLFNLLDSHDTKRLRSDVKNLDEYFAQIAVLLQCREVRAFTTEQKLPWKEAMIRTAADVCRGRILRPESMQSAAGSYLH